VEKNIDWQEILLPYNQAVNELVTKFRCLSEGFKTIGGSSPIERVEGRVKNASSIIQKANRKGVPFDKIETKIEDIAGVRIICRFVDDIYDVVGFIMDRNKLDMEIVAVRDYISNIKRSGYRSHHVIIRYPVVTALGKKSVLCEIQIRTMAMNFWAIIEHSLKYKYKGQLPAYIQERLKKSSDASVLFDNEIREIREEIIHAESLNLEKAAVVDEIFKSISVLHTSGRIDEAASINDSLFKLLENGSVDRLTELSRQAKAAVGGN